LFVCLVMWLLIPVPMVYDCYYHHYYYYCCYYYYYY
jgi:hypothetical protein